MNNQEQLVKEFTAAVENLTLYVAKVRNNGNTIILEKGGISNPEAIKKMSVFAAFVSAVMAVLFLLMAVANHFLEYNQSMTYILILAASGSLYYGFISRNVFGHGLFGCRRVTMDMRKKTIYIEEPPKAYSISFKDVADIRPVSVAYTEEEETQSYAAVGVWVGYGRKIFVESKEGTAGWRAGEHIMVSMRPLCNTLEILIKGEQKQL